MKEIIHNIIEYFFDMGEVGLGILAFIESSFFPIPPDLLLIALSLNLPQKALLFATICTIFSTLGGVLGYAIGKFGGRPIFNRLFKNKEHYLKQVEDLYTQYGIWALLLAAFTPIPYKVFTIASGIFSLNLPGFILTSIVGRGARFFIVAISLLLFGETIKSYIEVIIIGLALIALTIGIVIYKKKKQCSLIQDKQELINCRDKLIP